MPNISPIHLVIVLIIALIVIGPGKLPEVGAALGKSIKEFRKAASDITDSVSAEPAPASVAPAAVAPAAVVAPVAAVAAAPAPEAVVAAPAPVAAPVAYPDMTALPPASESPSPESAS